MKIIYKRADDNGISVVHGAPKDICEQMIGLLSDEEYKAHIWSKIPKDAINAFEIDENSLPDLSDPLRDAWIFIDNAGNITYCPTKSKMIALKKIANTITSLRLAIASATDIGESIIDLESAHIAAVQILANIKSANINTSEDVVNILKPLLGAN